MKTLSQGLRDLRFSVAGAGRVGSSLAHWLSARGAILVAAAGADLGGGSERLARELGGSESALDSLNTQGQDLLLVAVPDPALDEIVTGLAARPQAAVALHTSGSRAASVLLPLARKGTAVGSLHPLHAFPEILPEMTAAGALFAIDGDPAAQALARRLVAAWDGIAVEILPAQRPLYHLGATVAAGGVMTLCAVAAEIAHAAGLPPVVARGYLQLAAGAIAQALGAAPGHGAREGITGPFARGDVEVVNEELDRLGDLLPDLHPLLVRLGLETLRQAASGREPNANQVRLREALRSRG